MPVSPDRNLIHAILAQGVPAFFVCAKYGVSSDHLFDENKSVFAFIESFLIKNRVPTLEEVRIATGTELDPAVNGLLIDVETCTAAIIKRSLGKQLATGVRDVLELLKLDPSAARDALSQLVVDSTWSIGSFPTLPEKSAVEDIRKLYLEAEAKTGQLLGWGSPWPTMDKASLGLQRGELNILFAKKKLGKTFAKLAWVEHIWNKEMQPDDRILFLSMEMQPRLVYRRFAAIHLKMNYEQFRSGVLPPEKRLQLMTWCDDMIAGRLNKPKLTVISSNEAPSIRALSPIVAQLKPKLLVIDSFYMLQNKGDGQWEKTLKNVQDLKMKLANAFDIPVLASTQLKGTIKRDVVDADTDDAAYAKAIGDYADASRGLFGTLDHVRDNRRVWRGLESREFKPVDLLINFNLETMDFSEIQTLEAGQTGYAKDDEKDDKDDEDEKPRGKRKPTWVTSDEDAPQPKGKRGRVTLEDDDGPILSI